MNERNVKTVKLTALVVLVLTPPPHLVTIDHCSYNNPSIVLRRSHQRSARAGFLPGPARKPHGPARGPEFEFRARPVSARGMAKPGPARPEPTQQSSFHGISWNYSI